MTSSLRWLPISLVDAFVGVLALWQVLALGCVYGRLSFDTLCLIAPLALAGLALPFVTRPWDEARPGADPLPVPWALLGPTLLVALVAAAASALGTATTAVLAFALLPLLLAQVAPHLRPEDTAANELDARVVDVLAVGLTAVAAVLLTSWLRRPDVDDAYYVTAVLGHLEHPRLAVLSFDTVHGDPSVPIQQLIHRPQTYEVLVALLARALGLDGRTAYWLLAPALWAAATPLAHWALAKALAPRLAWLATPLASLVLVVWGEGMRTYGQFAFGRLYQGKAVFATVLAPLLLYATFRFVTAPSRRTWLRLLAAQLAATTFTSTALVVAPLAVGLALLAGLGLDRRRIAVALAGLATCLPVLGVLGLVWVELRLAGGLVSEGKEEEAIGALGRHRAELALLLLALGPLALRARAEGAVWLARYAIGVVVVVLSGLGPSLLGGSAAALMSLRAFWAVPMGPLVGLAVAASLAAVVRGVLRRRPGAFAVGLLGTSLAAAFVVAGPWATGRMGVGRGFLEYKVLHQEDRVADAVFAVARPWDTVLAPPLVAQHVVMRPRRPRVVGVWYRYVDNLARWWGEAESERRNLLIAWVRGHGDEPPVDELDAECVRIVVTAPSHRKHPETTAALEGMGFRRARVEAHDLWVRPVERLPGDCLRAQTESNAGP